MLNSLNTLLMPAALERLTLVVNHVLAGEPVATGRLCPHAGRCIAFQLRNWPSLLPQPPALAFLVTPAGLLEWCGHEMPVADLHVTVDAANPALLGVRLLAGQPPSMDIQGDAALAADVHWLAENLRWDITSDLERLFGPVIAHQLGHIGGGLSSALRRLVQLGGRWGGGSAPASRQPA
ncbi:MAG TPA: hypothetical protein VFP68_00340 [Burkholderiaceae bacterium]|nr:hypothetical protein [Burkholderiaceae bacterium]